LKKPKYERWQFSLDECKSQINIVQSQVKDEYGTAFLNLQLPDGRWLTFKIDNATRVPIYKENSCNKTEMKKE